MTAHQTVVYNEFTGGRQQRTCKDYLENQKFESKDRGKRHPRRCKWDRSKDGCHRNSSCAYLYGVQSNQEVGNVGNVDVIGTDDCQCSV